MPTAKANGVTLHYDTQGSGEPLILIPYLAADSACYAFQVAEYAKHFTCIAVDLRGTGESDRPEGVYSTELFADDVAALMQVLGVPSAHVFGLSLGAATGMWVAAKYPDKVRSLSLHSAWQKTDAFIKAVVQEWQLVAKTLDSVPEMVVASMFPWCFTPELYAARPDFIESLAAFVRSRPAQPVSAFMQHSNGVIAHDIGPNLERIMVPTQITFGRRDLCTSTRFAGPLTSAIAKSELYVFEDCCHAPLYENIEAFNQRTLGFLQRQVDAARLASPRLSQGLSDHPSAARA